MRSSYNFLAAFARSSPSVHRVKRPANTAVAYRLNLFYPVVTGRLSALQPCSPEYRLAPLHTCAHSMQSEKLYCNFADMTHVLLQPATLIQFDPAIDTSRPPSPCIGVCQMNPGTHLCAGCDRTIEEIMRWSTAADADKRAVWQLIQQRRRTPMPTPSHG